MIATAQSSDTGDRRKLMVGSHAVGREVIFNAREPSSTTMFTEQLFR